MHGAPAVTGGWSGVAAHGGLLLVRAWLFPKASIPPEYAVGEASIIIKGLEPTASSVRSFLAPAFGSGSGLAFSIQKNRVCNETIKRL